MRFAEVTEQNLADAGRIHSESWKASHRSFCTAEFVEKHTPSAQAEYLRRGIASGKRVYMLIDKHPVGIVSIQGSLIEDLYVLPTEQRKGYGTQLLQFAMEHCEGAPSLWILDNNAGACRLYTRYGFKETGSRNRLSDHLYELELAWHPDTGAGAAPR